MVSVWSAACILSMEGIQMFFVVFRDVQSRPESAKSGKRKKVPCHAEFHPC